MPSTSLTAIARATSEHNEQEVLVARALESERRVAVVRLVSLGVSSLSKAVIAPLSGDRPADMTATRLVPLILYVVYAIGMCAGLFRTKPNVRRARVLPIVTATVDIAFVMTMQWADQLQGHTELGPTGASLALVLTYAILRYGVESLIYSAVLTIAAYAFILHSAGQWAWGSVALGSFFYASLALLLYTTRRAMRTAFVDLKRRDLLARFVPMKVVDEIMAGRQSTLEPVRRDVTVLFSDVRGFTTYSESREPEDVLAFLDDYFGRMTQVVQGHDGSVNKFIGDGLMAIWGAPRALDDHPVRAVKAALDMQKVMAEINEHRVVHGEQPLTIGIGVHSGPVAAGMLGAGAQSEYSVIGDAVNLAARIESLTKEAGAMLLVSESTWSRLGDRFAGERLGEFAVKGRKAPVVLYAVTGMAPRTK